MQYMSEKRVYRDEKTSFHCPAARKKERLKSGDKPAMNRLSTAGFVSLSVYIRIRLFVLLRRRSGDWSSMLWRVRRMIFSPRCIVLLANRPSDPAPLFRRAPRPDPPIVCTGFRLERFLITVAPENAELVQNPVRKRRFVLGAHTVEKCNATITGTLIVRL